MWSSLATSSNTLFTGAMLCYTLVLLALAAEYAFGRQGRVARESAAVPQRELVGAGGPPVSEPVPPSDEVISEEARRRSTAETFGRVGITVAVVGVLLHAGSISLRGAAVDRVPWGNMYEFTSVACLVAMVAFLSVLVRQPKLRYLGGFVMLPVIILMFLAGTVLYAKAGDLVPSLRSYWLAIHVSAAASGTGIFMISSVGTVLDLVRSRYETATAAGKTPGRVAALGARLPSASSLDRMAYRTAAFGFPVYTFGIICGAIWAESAWGNYWGWDPKETWALITWVVYAAYLHCRATAGWRTKAGYINLLAFATLIFNFFVVNIVISGLHSYAGLN